MLEACVLAAVKKEASYGYKIIKDISPYIEISESTLYPILKRLEGSGSITAYTVEHNGRLRRYYRITDSGRSKIGEFLEDFKDVIRVYEYILTEGKND